MWQKTMCVVQLKGSPDNSLDGSDDIADCRFPIADLKIAPPGQL